MARNGPSPRSSSRRRSTRPRSSSARRPTPRTSASRSASRSSAAAPPASPARTGSCSCSRRTRSCSSGSARCRWRWSRRARRAARTCCRARSCARRRWRSCSPTSRADWPTYGDGSEDQGRGLPACPTASGPAAHPDAAAVQEPRQPRRRRVAAAGALPGRAGRGGGRLHPHRDLGDQAASSRTGKVVGVRTGDKGRGKDGEPLGNFEPGSDVHGQGHGARRGQLGHLTGAAIRDFDLGTGEPQEWELGVKEVWEVPKPLDRVIHTMGWPLRSRAPSTASSAARGSTRWARTRSRSASWSASTTPTHVLGPRRAAGVQDHPLHPADPRGRQARRLGRQDDPGGGYWAMPKLHGARRGDLRRRRRHGQRAELKGVHLRDARRACSPPRRSTRRSRRPADDLVGATRRVAGLRRSARTSTGRATCASRSRRASSWAARSSTR